MILTRTPYYKNIPWVRPSDSEQVDSYKLELFIWTGDKDADEPLFSTYAIDKENIEGLDTTDQIDIARLIEDFIDNSPIEASVTGVQDGNCSVWVKHQVKYTVGANITNELVVVDFATKGYAYGYEGENFASSKILLTDSSEIDADVKSVVYVPINRDLIEDNITVISYPNNTLNQSYSLSPTLESNEIVSILSIVCNDATGEDYIEVVFEGASREDNIYNIYLRDECKHTPHEVQFINRYGASQTLTFFNERKDDISVGGSQFESNNGQPKFGNHQFKKYNVNGKSSVTLNTGYIEEGSNDLVKQLILSESVWLDGVPVNCATESVEFKNRVNDKVVNYTIKFDNAFNELNTI